MKLSVDGYALSFSCTNGDEIPNTFIIPSTAVRVPLVLVKYIALCRNLFHVSATNALAPTPLYVVDTNDCNCSNAYAFGRLNPNEVATSYT